MRAGYRAATITGYVCVFTALYERNVPEDYDFH